VIGAGLTGLRVATVLRQAGHDVLVVERHGVGGVTTRQSTGKLTALQGSRYSTITDQRGADAAQQYATAATSGVRGLRALIESLGIDCGLTVVDDLTFSTQAATLARCTGALESAQAAGLPVEWVEDAELPFAILGGVRLADQAHLDPGALCAGLAAQLPDDRLLTSWAVGNVDEQRDGVIVEGPDGKRIHADQVVVATLAPIHDPALLSTRCSAVRSYGVAAAHPSPPACTAISVDDPSRSIRGISGPGRTGVVVVGEGHTIGEDQGRGSADRWAALASYAADALGAGAVTHRWVAHDLAPSDGIPFIGRCGPGAQRTWVATGFEKWGISTAFVAADLIRGELAGSPPPWAALFDPRRIAASATTELVRTGVRSARHLVVDRVKDALTGQEKRPRCTHLGCTLTFDTDERTWDCPCHGSRFGDDGQVVSGPATKPIRVDPSP
jgi:glycine/D-amino acid oxidase-like deaminating enzyme/nitrite reductase/ring-hydroxylating ferredoxin subunit